MLHIPISSSFSFHFFCSVAPLTCRSIQPGWSAITPGDVSFWRLHRCENLFRRERRRATMVPTSRRSEMHADAQYFSPEIDVWRRSRHKLAQVTLYDKASEQSPPFWSFALHPET